MGNTRSAWDERDDEMEVEGGGAAEGGQHVHVGLHDFFLAFGGIYYLV